MSLECKILLAFAITFNIILTLKYKLNSTYLCIHHIYWSISIDLEKKFI